MQEFTTYAITNFEAPLIGMGDDKAHPPIYPIKPIP
jgi:hypothetical protein